MLASAPALTSLSCRQQQQRTIAQLGQPRTMEIDIPIHRANRRSRAQYPGEHPALH